MAKELSYEQARSLYDAGLRWTCPMHYYAIPGQRENYVLSPRFQDVSIGKFLIGKSLDSVAAPDLEDLLGLLNECCELVIMGGLNLWCDDCTPGYHVRFSYHTSMLNLTEPVVLTADAPRAIDAAFSVLQQLLESAAIDPQRLTQYLATSVAQPAADPAADPAGQSDEMNEPFPCTPSHGKVENGYLD